jgi:5'-nucleotidase
MRPACRPPNLPAALALALALSLVASVAPAQSNEELIQQLQSKAVVSWHAATGGSDPVIVRLVAFNDLHGALATHAFALGASQRPLGGAAVLAAYVDAARAPDPAHTLLLIAGDSIGASELASGWLREEPTMAILNEFTDRHCPPLDRRLSAAPGPVATRCHVLATVGNHEFDHGSAELERLLYGGKHPGGPVLGHDWAGMHVPYLAANVVRRDGGAPFLPASAIVDLGEVKIGVIGAVTAETPGLVVAGRVQDLEFRPEAVAINAEVAKLRARGIRTIVLVIHEGLIAPTAPQWVAALAPEETQGRLAQILAALDGGIDVVIAGHTHKFNDLLVRLRDGTLALVTQARSSGTALSVIDLTLDHVTGATVAKEARIGTVWADVGLAPNRKVARIVAAATQATQAVAARPIGVAAAPIRRAESPAGESALGDFVADAERAAAGTDLAFVNPGGIRSDLEAGPVTYGALYAVQPFGNEIVKFSLTGAEVLELLEEQWTGAHAALPLFLRPAGLRYVFDFRRTPGHRVVAAWDADNHPLDPNHRYSVAANDFLTSGGNAFPVLARVSGSAAVSTDIAALEAYIQRAPGPLKFEMDGRMERIDASPP